MDWVAQSGPIRIGDAPPSLAALPFPRIEVRRNWVRPFARPRLTLVLHCRVMAQDLVSCVV